MANAKPTHLDAEGHRRVSDAVALAEAHTSGEIVTVVADRSDGYWDIALAWGVAAAILALCALAIAPDFYLDLYDSVTGGGWTQEWTAGRIFWLSAMVVFLKFAGMALVQLWPPLKYLLIPGQVKTQRVHRRAMTCFRIGAERRTHGRTGILIYVSLREHRAEILADEAIAARVSDEVWGDTMVAMLAGIRAGDLAGAMIAGVERVGAVLAEHFPRGADDINEIPDRLIEL